MSETDTLPAGFVRAASLEDFDDRNLLGVVVNADDRVCLVRYDGDVYALEDRCTHALYPLSRGTLLDGGRVECGWHGAQFDCRSGEPCRGPATLEAQTYEVLLRDGDVYVKPR